MKKFYLIIVLILIFRSAFSQYSLETEVAYLKTVNTNAYKFLIQNNIYDAEKIADTLIYIYGEKNDLASDFFYNLAESYFILKKYDLALFTIERQRLLYPSSDADIRADIMIVKCLTKLKLQDKKEMFLDKTSTDEVAKSSISKRLTDLFSLGAIMYSKNLNNFLYEITDVYAKRFDKKLPFNMAKWQILSGCPPHCIKKYYSDKDILNTNKDYKLSDLLTDVPKCAKVN